MLMSNVFFFFFLVNFIEVVAQMVKNLLAVQETLVWSLGREDPLEKGMAAHSSILAWKIPWTEEPGGLQSMGLQRGKHERASNTFIVCLQSVSISSVEQSDSVTHTHTHTYKHMGAHSWTHLSDSHFYFYVHSLFTMCVNFFCTAKWLRWVCVYIYSFSFSFPLWFVIGYWLQLLCYTVGPCYLPRILIQGGPLGQSKLCSWLTPMNS